MPDAPPRSLRFSLLNLLLVAALISLSLALFLVTRSARRDTYRLNAELSNAEQMIRGLRSDLGYFPIEDETQIYFRNERVSNFSRGERLRLHLPFGRRYRCCVQVHDFQRGSKTPVFREPAPDLTGRRPRLLSSIELTPGYGTVSLYYRRNHRGELKAKLYFSGETLPSGEQGSFNSGWGTLDIPEVELGQDRKLTEGHRGWTYRLKTFPPDKPCVLLKVSANAGGLVDAPEDHGITVWLEPIEGELDTPRWWEREPAGGDSAVSDDFFDATDHSEAVGG